MKFNRFSSGTLGLLAVGVLAWGCSDKASDCIGNLSCMPFGEAGSSASGAGAALGGGGGSGGGSGRGGASGRSGGNSGADDGQSGTSGMSGSPGGNGNAGAAGGPAACDGSLGPDADDCVISDDFGTFVSAAGDNSTADGTVAKPFSSLTRALTALGPTKRVYVCADEYVEPATLQIPDHVAIYGGFTCAGGAWKYDAPIKAHLMPDSPVGAVIASAKNGVTLQDIRIDAKDAPQNNTGASSFGMTIVDSVGVVLTRVEIRAGKGGGGKAGSNGASGVDGLASGVEQNGKAGSCLNPPLTQAGGTVVTQQGCGSQGGVGGRGSTSVTYSAFQDGDGGFPIDLANGGKGASMAGQNGAVGTGGSNGAPGAFGTVASPIGTFSATGYVVSSGAGGSAGKPGQGGGGGGASLGKAACVGASGGAGGMGGCGGEPGTGGTGGGASVALLSWSSSITIDACTLIASAGGAGGSGGVGHGGGAGKAGGAGGDGDTINAIGEGGPGGKGGAGGNGGNSAGGTGGPSIALVYGVTMPELKNNSILTFGEGGALGVGGRLGVDSATWGPDGSKGLASELYPKP